MNELTGTSYTAATLPAQAACGKREIWIVESKHRECQTICRSVAEAQLVCDCQNMRYPTIGPWTATKFEAQP